MPMIELGSAAWPTFAQGTTREWLETNGLGGWAFSTVLGANTRFYHGLLAAASQPPVQRILLVAKMAETLLVDGVPYRLDANAWGSGAIEEESRLHLRRFALEPFPTFAYSMGGVTVTRRIFMRHGQNTTVVRYEVVADRTRRLQLQLAPLVTHRSIHSVQRGAAPWEQRRLSAPAPLTVRMHSGAEAPPVYLYADGGEYRVTNLPIYDIYYPYEELRGEPTREDLLESGRLTVDLDLAADGGGRFSLAFSTDLLPQWQPAAWQDAEERRREGLLSASTRRRSTNPAPNPQSSPCASLEAGFLPLLRDALTLAADQFLVQRASTGTATVIAGYPWFTDWGRDTMIALPGLTLATGRPELALELLLTFARYERDGLIPNLFPDEGTPPLYNTADASLWFFQAVRRYLQATGDAESIRTRLYPILQRIVAAHLTGTHFDIHVTPDGLLHCGNPGVQVTWMDAKIGDWVVTPRDGFPVEIQALWHGALCVMAELATRFGEADAAARYAELARQTADSFRERFWYADGGYLLDRLTSAGAPDPTLRPNQLFALSLPYGLVPAEQARRVLQVCEEQLLIPCGLRSLGPDSPAYHPHYQGTRLERDAAYHQGTAWGWLLGPFARAYLAVHGPGARPHVLAWLRPVWEHLHEAGIGSISEIFDADAPFTPRGCIAQAWSVAEVLEIIRILEES